MVMPNLKRYIDCLIAAWIVCLQALEDAFLAIDSQLTTEEVIKELAQIAGRPQEEAVPEKVADEDDGKKKKSFRNHLDAILKVVP